MLRPSDNRRDIRTELAGLLDTEPKQFDLHIAVVNPSGGGSWIAGVVLGGIRIYGPAAGTSADAVRNLFHKLTATQGYAEDSQIQVALEMALAGKGAMDFLEESAAGPALNARPADAERKRDPHLQDLVDGTGASPTGSDTTGDCTDPDCVLDTDHLGPCEYAPEDGD